MIAKQKAKNFSVIYCFCLKERFSLVVYRENKQKTKMSDISSLSKKWVQKAWKIACFRENEALFAIFGGEFSRRGIFLLTKSGLHNTFSGGKNALTVP